MSTLEYGVRNGLLEGKLVLVRRCVKTFLRRRPWLSEDSNFDRDDLIQVGALKVAEVLDTIDISRIRDLDAYLFACVEHAITDAAHAMANSILSASRARSIRRFWAIQRELEKALNRKPTESEIVDAMGDSWRVVQRLTRDSRMYGPQQSLDAPLSDEGDATLLDVIPAPAHDSEQPYRGPLSEIIGSPAMLQKAGLNESEEQCVRLRFGIGEDGSHAPEDIAALKNVSTGTVKSIVTTAREKLFCFLIRETSEAIDARTAHVVRESDKLTLWRQGAECWRTVTAASQKTWSAASFIAAVSRFYGCDQATLLAVKNGKPVNFEVTFARNVLMGLLYHIKGMTAENVARAMNTTTTSVYSRLRILRRRLRTVGLALPDQQSLQSGHAIIRTQLGSANPSFRFLNADTTVDLRGFPFLWAVKKILSQAPNVRRILIAPCCASMLSVQARRLCEQRGVTLSFGRRFRAGSKLGENRSPHFEEQRRFLLNLRGEQRARFKRLLKLENRAALITARYFCLKGETVIAQSALAQQFDLSHRCTGYMSAQINAVLYLLGYSAASFAPGREAKAYAARMAWQVRVASKKQEDDRALRADTDRRAKLGKQLGVPPLARKFPIKRLNTYRKLLKAREKGRLKKLKTVHPKAWQAVTLRFGLDTKHEGVYRTLQQVVDTVDGVNSRQRVCQLENEALRFLRIAE